MRYAIVAFISAIFAISVSPAHAQRSGGGSQTDRYRVLTQRNIFLKDRTQAATRPSPTTQPTPSDPEHALVLRGIVEEDGAYRAYIENTDLGTMDRLSVGDAVARGTIADIDINAVAYNSPGQRLWITIGSDLSGRAPESAEEVSPIDDTTPATTPAGMENVNPNDPSLTMEQRLKLRRMQELKGK